MTNPEVIDTTGKLFGDLWRRYDDALFEQSVGLFAQRFRANGFDLAWFRGKRCLDAGCGGGRYSIAMARLGAAEVVGCDISATGLADARNRAEKTLRLRFDEASVLGLPYPDASFDFVCCSGVLHHTTDAQKGLSELTRVLKPGGRIFLLLYGTGGLRWPTIVKIRSHAQVMGYAAVDEMMRLVKLPANKQRTFLDDLFVPVIQFYDWDQVNRMLFGYRDIQRWTQGKLDHEASVPVQRAELEQLAQVFELAGKEPKFHGLQNETSKSYAFALGAVEELDRLERAFKAKEIDQAARDWAVFGWEHHRVLAIKE